MRVTKRIAIELANHEGCVQEAYKDSVGVWTWGVGVTSASGHYVERYKNNPQPVPYCLDVFKWLLETKYARDVNEVFKDCPLTEEQFAGALSFHYNTGRIRTASWVKYFKQGNMREAERRFLQWNKPKDILERRQKEANLIFRGKWAYPNITTVPVYTKVNSRYSPVWSSRKDVDISEYIKEFDNPTLTEKPVEQPEVKPVRFNLWEFLRGLFGVD